MKCCQVQINGSAQERHQEYFASSHPQATEHIHQDVKEEGRRSPQHAALKSFRLIYNSEKNPTSGAA